jgi:hypothetical protein
MDIHCQTGLAGRVTSLANGLAVGGTVDFWWRQNAACPFPHAFFFPHGIAGVTFHADQRGSWMTRIDGKTCDCYRPGDAAADAAYAVIIAAMTGQACHAPELAISARFFRHPAENAASLAHAAARFAVEIGAAAVFLMADSRRAPMTRILEAAGIKIILPRSAELTTDLDRQSMTTFPGDWKTLLAAKSIITHSAPTGLLHPAMAAGTPIHRV